MIYKKIWIFGGSASGKTTLAKRISNKIKIPVYSTDDFVYKRKWDKKYSDATQIRKLNQASKKSRWIIEGIHRGNWIKEPIKKADLIIILKIRRPTLIFRILRRQKSRRNLGESGVGYKNTIKLIWWALKHRSKKYILLCPDKQKIVILKNNKQIEDFLEKIR